MHFTQSYRALKARKGARYSNKLKTSALRVYQEGEKQSGCYFGVSFEPPNKEHQWDAAASSVLVVMIKVVVLDFKQSVGYFFQQKLD